MDFKQKINLMVDDLTGAPYFNYARKSEANIIFDDEPNTDGTGEDRSIPIEDRKTAVLLIEPDSFGWINDPVTGEINEYYDVHIQFVQQFEMGLMADMREPVIKYLKGLAKEFIYSMLNDEAFELYTTNIPAVPIIDYYDANLVGVEINIARLVIKDAEIC